MRVLAACALAILVAGCANPLENGTPAVVVVHEFTWTPEPGAGLARAAFGSGCVSGAYDRRAPSVEYYGEAPVSRPDFVVVHDFGDAWRDAVQGSAAGIHSVVAVGVLQGGGGALEPWVGDAAVAREGRLAARMATAFPEEDADLPALEWRDGRAWLGDEALEEGRGRVGSSAFDVATDLGAPIHVLHRWSATYLGEVEVGLHARPDDCRAPSVLLLPGPVEA